MISLTWKCIISSVSGREAFNTPLSAVVGKSMDGKCKQCLPCPGSSMKILISQLALQENKSCCMSFLLKPFFSKACLSACSCPFGFSDQSQWALAHFSIHPAYGSEVWGLPSADMPVVQPGLQRWSWCGYCPRRIRSWEEKTHMSKPLIKRD